MKTFIYGLYSSDSKIRYIGKSDDPKKRLRRHLQQVNDSKTHKNSWIKKQLSENKGTNNIQDNLKINYLSYDDVKNWIVLQNIKTTSKNWKLLNLPNFIPRRPERYYKKRGWISWSDFLSDNNRISNLDKKKFKNNI